MEIRKATYADLDSLMEVFEGAKAIMRTSGNIHQWNDEYPSETIVRDDIEKGQCYVACEGDIIIGTMAFIPGPDPTYSCIEGNWPNDNPYYIIHRIAAPVPGRNVSHIMFDWAFAHMADIGYDTIRIDTHRNNRIMKHILAKNGFSECGVIYLENGDPRDAYQWDRKYDSGMMMKGLSRTKK